MELFFLAMLFLLMMYALGSGYPVAFALPGSAIITIVVAGIAGQLFTGDSGAYFIQDGPVEWLTAGVTNFRGIYWEVERDTLIAIPLFIFMGIMLQRSKIAEDLLVTMAQLFGPMPGGLGISVVFVGALLAATTGIVGATVVAMGLISLPAMLRNNYSQSLATGTICASGTLGQIIPPSIVLIILADQLSNAADQAQATRQSLYKEATGDFSMPSDLSVVSTSAGDMFLGAFIPGIVLVLLYMAYILISAVLRPHTAPAVHYEGKLLERDFVVKVLLALIPPLALIFVVLGSIIAGIATVNQAGASGAVGATIMAAYRLHEGRKGAFYPAILSVVSVAVIYVLLQNYNLNIRSVEAVNNRVGIVMAIIAVAVFVVSVIWSLWRTYKVDDTLMGVMQETAKTTSLVFIILLGAAMLTAAFRGFGGEEVVKHFLSGLPGGFWTQFVVVMAVIFLLGFFLDFIEIAVVVVPIVAPILLADPSANVTAVWLGVMIGLNIQTSFLTPPFGFALFYLRGVASKAVKTIEMYKGVVPFIILQLAGLVIVGFYPPLVNFLPVSTYLSSETAPPPKNPRLQACLEDHIFTVYEENRGAIEAEIATVASLDLSGLPKSASKSISGSIDKASSVFDMVEDVRAAEQNVTDAAVSYREIHTEVRQIERDIRRFRKEIEDSGKRMKGTDDEDRIQRYKDRIAELEAMVAASEAGIPAEWTDTNKSFNQLNKELAGAQRIYRKSVDDAYLGIVEMITVIDSAEALESAAPAILALHANVSNMETKAVFEELKVVVKPLRAVAGASKIASLLEKAGKEFKRKKPKMKKAMKNFDKAVALLEEEVAWRGTAKRDLLQPLKNFEVFMRAHIGLRQQERLGDDDVDAISGCLARHRDISLKF